MTNDEKCCMDCKWWERDSKPCVYGTCYEPTKRPMRENTRQEWSCNLFSEKQNLEQKWRHRQ